MQSYVLNDSATSPSEKWESFVGLSSNEEILLRSFYWIDSSFSPPSNFCEVLKIGPFPPCIFQKKDI
jgi:hypothetical protein